MSAFRIIRRLRDLLDVDTTGATAGDALVLDVDGETWVPGAGGGGGGVTDADYLVGTSQAGLSAEIVVGTSPGGELGGTWASPTVDTTHAGSSHASVQAAAEATAAGELSSHASDTTGVHGIADTASLVLTGDSRLSDSRAPSGTAGGVLGGTYPNPSFASDMATQAELDAHINDTSAAHAASAISADSTTLVGTGTDVQAVFEELDNAIVATETVANAAVAKSLYDANTVLAADTDNTPAALTMGASTILARLAAGNIKAATPSELRTLLALVIGTNTQAWDADLDAIAALSPSNDDIIQRKAGAWTNRTMAQLLTDLGITTPPVDGWTAAGETWTYASADSPTFTFTVAADVTTKYAVGQRIKLTQTTAKYFIITAVSTFSGGNTTITIYGGTDYTLANASITSPYWSMLKAPFAFPLSPAKWTVTTTDSTNRLQSNPTASTWYNPGSISISVPIGAWDVQYRAVGYVNDDTNTLWDVFATLSTANNTESDTEMTCQLGHQVGLGGSSQTTIFGVVTARKTIAVAAKTSYFMNTKASSASTNSIGFLNTNTPCVIRAVCAYL